jgi:hypothetical protein
MVNLEASKRAAAALEKAMHVATADYIRQIMVPSADGNKDIIYWLNVHADNLDPEGKSSHGDS